MKNQVKELKVLDLKNNTNIFDGELQFIIPLYQRAYAWEDKQLVQLLEDVNDIEEGEKYYIGSLIVSNTGEKLEVIDGQQRLTSLYLLLNCLGINTKHSLSFACRKKSNYTLEHIHEVINETDGDLEGEMLQDNIKTGIKILKENIGREDFDKNKFIEKLSRVILYQIEVPENTDMNRYFEIMNTRGEQLEQHDILKAKLMDYLGDNAEMEKEMFSIIWDACSDMDGYVQMHFISKNNVVRKELFGDSWNDIPIDTLRNYSMRIIPQLGKKQNSQAHKISEIIDQDFKTEEEEGYNENDERVRFESIISFPYFLLHALKVFIWKKEITHQNPNKKIMDDLLDDKKLITSFNNVIENGIQKDKPIKNDRKKFVRDFTMCLLQTRILFDEYIIKREYANNSNDGEWSLKTLYVSGQGSQKKPYFKNSIFTRAGEWDKTNRNRCKTNIMLESALRVSYTSPKVMHWITSLLSWLTEVCLNKDGKINEHIAAYSEIIEQEAIDEVKNFFKIDNCLNLGVNTPHIILNYLDYLIWERDKNSDRKYEDFTFEFRNSVEHWYPQNPSKGTFDEWDQVDRFGNLCLLQRNINSQFSNIAPEAKKSNYKPQIEKGSLKLRVMAERTSTQQKWKDFECAELEEEMVELLKSKITEQE